MPRTLEDFPRPPGDNGRGLHGSPTASWNPGNEGYDFWIAELIAMGIKWFKILDDGGNSLPFCERLLAAGIFPIVRVLRKDPPPNDTPEPNPGHIGPPEEETIRRLIAAGVRYIETNNEPDLDVQWKHNAMPHDPVEAAKIVALNWLFDARLILELGGLPGLPAISTGGELDLMGALLALNRHDILLEGAWIALHNDCLNRPVNYPDDPVNRAGQPLTPEDYNRGPYTEWAWWNGETGNGDNLGQVNAMRAEEMNSSDPIDKDHACFRAFEYYNRLAVKYLGRSIPILSTEGGYRIGAREDVRYPRVTPRAHSEQTVAMFEYMQRQAPDFYFATVPSYMIESIDAASDAWYSKFWQKTLKDGAQEDSTFPPIVIPFANLGDHLLVVDAVKSMSNLARRLPGAQPPPPMEAVIAPKPPAEPIARQESKPEPGPIARTAPKPEPRPIVGERVATEAGRVPFFEYVAQPGESLSMIAKKFGTTWQSIAEANKIMTPNLLRPGQSLVIPVSDRKSAASSAPNEPPPSFAPEPIPERDPVQAISPAPSENLLKEPPRTEIAPSTADSRRDSMDALLEIYNRKPPRVEQKVTPPQVRAVETTPQKIDFIPSELEWDPRLEALNIGLYPVEVDAGRMYWKLLRAMCVSSDASTEKDTVYFKLVDENNQPIPNHQVWLGWRRNRTDATTNENGEAAISLSDLYAPEYPENGLYFVGIDGLPSDRVAGVNSPLRGNESFRFLWKRAVAR